MPQPRWVVTRQLWTAVTMTSIWAVVFVARLIGYITGDGGAFQLFLVVLNGLLVLFYVPSVVYFVRLRRRSGRSS